VAQAFRVDHRLPSILLHHYLRGANERASRGELSAAQAEFRAAAAIQPTDFVALDGYGRTLVEQGDLAGALDVYVRGRAAHPLDPRLHASVGTLQLRLGRPAEAYGSLKVAVQLEPRQWEAWMSLGDALRELRRLPEAEDAYRHSLSVAPEPAVAFNKLGIVLALQGRSGEAEAAFRQALALQPGFSEAATNLERLRPSLIPTGTR
jgi:Flp pilus assembly protein TadD